ncbi:primase-helicase family protein [Variovorax sp. RB3P1]|uniref:primase-helicase family protein n=1 Tax=Variovorax sp. RB3P1 TaxID=3443732 RepID=UPI003F479F30
MNNTDKKEDVNGFDPFVDGYLDDVAPSKVIKEEKPKVVYQLEDTTFEDQYPQQHSQTLEEELEDSGWTMQLQNAIDERDLEPELKALYKEMAEFRQQYAIVNYSGATYIQSKNSVDGLVFQKIGDFHSYNARHHHHMPYVDSKGVEKIKEVFVSKMFLKDKLVRRYEGVEFAPGNGNDNFLNLWKGWKVLSVKGQTTLFEQLIAALCNDDAACVEYMYNYLAHLVQKPEEKPEVAIVMKGAQGIGKGSLMKLLGSYTDNYKHLSSTQSLVGQFSGHLIDAFIVFADEAVWGGDKTAEGRLKAMISEPTMSIVAKGKDEIYVRSYCRLFVASNEDWVVPVGEGDRRYFVLDCSPRYKGHTQPGQFFDLFNKWMDNGGKEAVFHFLMNRDISNFNPKVFPKTQARVDLQIRGLSTTQRFVYELLTGDAQISDDTLTVVESKHKFHRNRLYADFVSWCNIKKINFIPSHDDLGRTMSKVLEFEKDNANWRTNWSRKVEGKTEYFYQVNSAKEAMERFAMNICEVPASMVFFNYEQMKNHLAATQPPK